MDRTIDHRLWNGVVEYAVSLPFVLDRALHRLLTCTYDKPHIAYIVVSLCLFLQIADCACSVP